MDRLRATVYEAADLAAAARIAFGGDDNGGSGPSTSDKMCKRAAWQPGRKVPASSAIPACTSFRGRDNPNGVGVDNCVLVA